MRQQLVRSIRCAALAAGLLVALLAAGPATAGAQSTPGYRIIGGQISYNGSATRQCPTPSTGSCGDIGNGWNRSSLDHNHGTAATFSVHSPGGTVDLPQGPGTVAVPFAPLRIDSWNNTYDWTDTGTSGYCESPESTKYSHSDLQHDGGTSPSLYDFGVRISRGSGSNELDVSLAQPGDADGIQHYASYGIRYPVYETASSILGNWVNTSPCPDRSGTSSGRENLWTYSPTDFYPESKQNVQQTAASGPPVCDSAGTCVVHAQGTSSWSYGPQYGGDDISGSMRINWSVDVEFGCATVVASEVDGVRPAWRSGDSLADFPNDDAMCAATWVPRIDERFVPQGLALRGGSALISGYTCRFADSGDGCRKKSKTERCRLMSVQLSTGRVTANRHFSRQQCAHGGGVAVDPKGHIWIADTKKLVFLNGIHDNQPKKLALKSPIEAAFLTETPSGRIQLGDWAQKGSPQLWTFKWKTLYRCLAKKVALKVAEDCDASTKGASTEGGSVDIPQDAQGAAYGPGGLWVARSTSKWGKLRTRSRSLGFGPGVEEIEFAADGSLWAVFEAGSKKFPAPRPFLPVIARFDVDALK